MVSSRKSLKARKSPPHEYQLRLRLAEYATEGMDKAEARKTLTDPEKLNHMEPEDVVFEQELRVRAEREVSGSVFRGAEEINFVCSVGKRSSEGVPVTVDVEYIRIVDIVKKRPVKSTSTAKSTI